jgi:hypothetical protein
LFSIIFTPPSISLFFRSDRSNTLVIHNNSTAQGYEDLAPGGSPEMSTISKITNSLASATNVFTAAIANFSFDFSLMKVEAPVEFHDLGRGLSDQRRTAAENGTPHMAARKLGALFKDIPPSTPQLVKAYGTRASEVAGLQAVNWQGDQSSSLFSIHAGVDGTSVWAAATSGPEALPI